MPPQSLHTADQAREGKIRPSQELLGRTAQRQKKLRQGSPLTDSRVQKFQGKRRIVAFTLRFNGIISILHTRRITILCRRRRRRSCSSYFVAACCGGDGLLPLLTLHRRVEPKEERSRTRMEHEARAGRYTTTGTVAAARCRGVRALRTIRRLVVIGGARASVAILGRPRRGEGR